MVSESEYLSQALVEVVKRDVITLPLSRQLLQPKVQYGSERHRSERTTHPNVLSNAFDPVPQLIDTAIPFS